MNELKVFEGNEVEIIEKDGVLLFEIYTTGIALGQIVTAKGTVYANKERLNKNLESAEITPVSHNAKLYITEEQLYDLMLEMRTDKVKPFRKWVTSEVLPSIRKNGGYIAGQETLSPEQIVANALVVANRILADREKQLEEMKPKAAFFDAVADSKDAISIGEVAKVLNMGIGRNKLFEILRKEKVLMKNNEPYQKYVDNSMFRVIEQRYQKNGETCINIKTLVYQKGLNHIRRILEDRL